MTTYLLLLKPTLSGVISHAHISQDRSWYGTMIVPRLILYFTQARTRETYLSTFFIDLEGRVSFAYVPVRDQNLVVRGKN